MFHETISATDGLPFRKGTTMKGSTGFGGGVVVQGFALGADAGISIVAVRSVVTAVPEYGARGRLPRAPQFGGEDLALTPHSNPR